MKQSRIFCAIVASLLVGQAAVAQVQTFTYDNDAQLIGAAIASPESTKLILEKVVHFCSASDEQAKLKVESAYARWVDRHKTYLRHSAGYRDAAKAVVANPSAPEGQRAAIRKLLEQDIPRLVESQSQAVILPLQVAKENGGGDQMCVDFFKAVDAAKFDLRVRDPQLSNFLDKRAPR